MARCEMAVCEVCSRIYPATMMLGRICPACARKPQTPKPVDFYSLADDDEPVRRTCKDCGASFLGHRIARYCPACRERHNKEASQRQAEKRREAKGKPKPAHPVCAICGAQLPNFRFKYCAACAAQRAQDRIAAYRLAHKTEINAAQRAKYHARKASEVLGHGEE